MSKNLTGAKGASTPVEASDTLRSTQRAEIVDLLGEGHIAGLVNGLKSVYLDGVPVENADGSRNFPEFAMRLKLGGPTDATPEQGFSSVQTEVAVGVEVRQAVPVVRSIADGNVDRVRITIAVPALVRSLDNGDRVGAKFEWAVEVQSNGGGYVERFRNTVDGKASSPYTRQAIVDLKATGPAPWDVRVRRITDDSSSSNLVDAFSWQSYTAITSVRMQYRHRAVAELTFDARYFQAIPTRAYDLMGVDDWDIPVNYDPLARTTSGSWNGTFKQGWTNNPAWVLYNLVKHRRYGLGEYVPQLPDKWTLYQLAAWCDAPVSNGRGGTEPRYAINAYLQAQAEALVLLQDIAAVFRGAMLYGAGALSVTWDEPASPVASYTPANVVANQFNYADGSRAQKKSSCTCWYNDLGQMGKRAAVTWDDADLVAKYGMRRMEINPIGITSPSAALRMAKWALYTIEQEDQVVSFRVGAEGAAVRVGQVFQITDPAETGERLGGRIHAATTGLVTLDAPVELLPGETYKLWVTVPDAANPAQLVLESRTVTGAVAVGNALVNGGFEAGPMDGLATGWRVITGSAGDAGRVHAFSLVGGLASAEFRAQRVQVLSVTVPGVDSVLLPLQAVPVPSGATHAAVGVNARSNAPGANLLVRVYRNGFTAFDDVTVPLPAGPVARRLTRVVSIPAGADAVEVHLRGLVAAGEWLEADDAMLEWAAVAGPYQPQRQALSVSPAFSVAPAAESVWVLEGTDVAPTLWRYVGISEQRNDTGALEYEISGVAHSPGKWALIEANQPLTQRPARRLSDTASRPLNLQLTELVVQDGQTFWSTLQVAWEPTAAGQTYVVAWRYAESVWLEFPPTAAQSVDIPRLRTGVVEVKVTARVASGHSSEALEGSITLLGNLAAASAVTGLQVLPDVNGYLIKWAKSPDFDYTTTELRLDGTTWDDATPISNKASTTHLLGWPSAGTHVVRARHHRRGGPAGAVAQGAFTYNGTPAALVNLLTGQLGSAQLDAALSGEVAKISGDASLAGSVAARVLTETNNRITGDAVVQQAVDKLTVQAGRVVLLNADFSSGTTDNWTGLDGVSIDSSARGGQVGFITRGDKVIEQVSGVSVSTSRLYRVRVRMRRTSGSGGNAYVGVSPRDASGAIINNPSGGSAPYCAALGVTMAADGVWRLYEGNITGVQSPFPSATPDYGKFWPGTVTVAPLVLAINGWTGRLEIDYAEITDITDQAALGVRIDEVDARVDTSESSIIDLQTAFADDQTAQATTVQRLIAQRAGEVLNSDPWITSLDNWSSSPFVKTTVPNLVLSAAPVGEAARNVLRATAGDTAFPVNMPGIPIDATRRYRVSGRARRHPSVSSGRFYLLVALYRADQTNINGDGTYWFYAAALVDPGSAGTTYTAEFGAGSARPFPTDARWMTVGALLGYTAGGAFPFNAGGWMEVWDLRITDVTTSASLQSQITSVSEAVTTEAGTRASAINAVQSRIDGGGGGVNRLANAGFLQHNGVIPDNWSPYNAVTTAIVAGPDGYNAVQVAWTGTNGLSRGIYQAPINQAMKAGVWYIYAFKVAAPAGSSMLGQRVTALASNAPGFSDYTVVLDPVLTTSYQWYVAKVRRTAGDSGELFLSEAGSVASGNFYITQPIIHEGEVFGGFNEGALYASVAQEISTRASQVGILNAKWSVTFDVNGRVSGFTSVANGDKTTIDFLADVTTFSRPGSASKPVFAVYTASTVVGDITVAPGIYARGANIDVIDASQINTRGLTVRAADGTVIFSAGVQLDTPYIKVGAATNAQAQGTAYTNNSYPADFGFQTPVVNVVTLVSSGAKVFGVGDLVGEARFFSASTAVSCELSYEFLVDGSVVRVGSTKRPVHIESGTAYCGFNIPIVFSTVPSAASHVYQVRLFVLSRDGSGNALSRAGYLNLQPYLFVQENKI